MATNNDYLAQIAGDLGQGDDTGVRILNNEYLRRISEGIDGIVKPETGKVDANKIDGVIPAANLPSFVDDVVEGYLDNGTFYSDSQHTEAITPETGKVYVDLSADTSYRWGGSAYIAIGRTLDAASQQEAEAGSDNAKYMTPLRTKQAIDSLSPAGLGITGAEIGEFARVKTADSNGTPTSWESAPGFVPTAEDMEDIAELVVPMVSPEIDRLAGNVITADLSGEGILTADDAYHAPLVSFGADGKSEQTVTTGKNLLSNLNADWEVRSGFTAGRSSRLCTLIEVEDGESYHYHRGSTSPGMAAGWCNGTDLSGYVSINNLTNQNYTFTNSDGYSYLCVSYVASDGTPSITVNNCELIIETGTSFTSYEPYSGGSASPRPDWPQEITDIDAATLHATGKNLCGGSALRNNMSKSNAVTLSEDSYGQYAAFSNGTGDVDFCNNVRFKANTAYTFVFRVSCTRLSKPWNAAGYYTDGSSFDIKPPNDFDGTTPQTWAISTSGQKTIRNIERVSNGGSTCVYYNDCGIFEGVITVGQYEPYQGFSTQVDLQGHHLRSLPNGTHDELLLDYRGNSASGGVYGVTLVQRVGEVDLGDLTWTVDNDKMRSGNIATMATGTSGAYQAMCNIYAPAPCVTPSGSAPNKSIMVRHVNRHIMVRDDSYSDASVFGAAMDGIYAYVPLATPVTHDLGTVTIPAIPAPDTHFWLEQDTNKSLTYERDANMVVDRLHGLCANIAPVEGDKASTNYVVGSYLVHDDKLCKVTSAIGTGETIAIGTNVAATTVAAEILAIN